MTKHKFSNDGFEPLRSIYAPDDGRPFYVTAILATGTARVEYGLSDWPSRCYWIIPNQEGVS